MMYKSVHTFRAHINTHPGMMDPGMMDPGMMEPGIDPVGHAITITCQQRLTIPYLMQYSKTIRLFNQIGQKREKRLIGWMMVFELIPL